jgi:hypothetical protein
MSANNGPDNPLDGGLEGYWWGLVPRVPWATGYILKKSGYDPIPSSGK